MTEIGDHKSTPEARAERLKRIRNLANLSRKEMCEGTDLNVNTLKGWEISRFGGLSKSGANKVAARVALAGVTCNAEWLLYEIGEPPQVNLLSAVTEIPEFIPAPIPEDKQKEQITQELLLFRSHNPKAIDLVMTDESMTPCFAIGDVVAGLQVKNSVDAIGKYSIVILEDGKKLLRNVCKGNAENHFNLLASNLEAVADHLVLSNVAVKALAPIIWHRKLQIEMH